MSFTSCDLQKLRKQNQYFITCNIWDRKRLKTCCHIFFYVFRSGLLAGIRTIGINSLLVT